VRAMAVGLLFAMLPSLHAQDFTHFDAASVRPSSMGANSPPILQGGPGSADPGQIRYVGMPLVALLLNAYGLRSFQVLSLPDSVASARFDINAKIPAGATEPQFNTMLQNLLVERFNLRFHHESRDVAVNVLTIGPNGPKLKASAKPQSPKPENSSGKQIPIGAPNPEGFPTFPPGFSGVVGRPSNGHMRLGGQRASLAKLTPWLESSLDKPLVDQTGLTGEYDFLIDFDWWPSRAAGARDDPSDPAPSVAEAVASYLGLKLEAKKLPFEMMVIDRIDREPSAN